MHHHTHGIGFQYDEEKRREKLDPEKFLRAAGLQEGMAFMDIGCNDGFFAIPAAKIVGSSGKVYGVDIDPEAIQRLARRATEEGLENIEARAGTAEETLFCDGCADMIFFGIVLHDFNDPAHVLKNARAMLATGGKLINLDWKKEPTEAGPPLSVRLSEADASTLIEEAGLTVSRVDDFSPDFYLIIATRP